MKKIIYTILVFINGLFAMGLLFSYLSVYINPKYFWMIAAFGLSYKLLLFINLLFLILWISKKKKYFIMPALVILIGWNHLLETYQLPMFKKNQKEAFENIQDDAGLKIISYNVRLFNLFPWAKEGPKLNEIVDFIIKENPDVVCFQEFYSKGKDEFSIKSINRKLKNYPYRHIQFLLRKADGKNYGIATYSKYPIVNRKSINFNNSLNISIYSDIVFKGDTIRIINNHLQSTRFTTNDHRFLDEFLSKPERRMERIKGIGNRLKEAFVKRSEQSILIHSIAKKSTYPVIVCGDFNDTPLSFTYRKIRQNMSDAFVESGLGSGVTFVGKKFFSFRIDYLLHSKEFLSKEYTTYKVKHSDHYPIGATFFLKPNEVQAQSN